jgi:hypothetical protein
MVNKHELAGTGTPFDGAQGPRKILLVEPVETDKKHELADTETPFDGLRDRGFFLFPTIHPSSLSAQHPNSDWHR